MANLRLLIEVLTKNTGDLRKLNGDLKRTGEEAEKTGSKLGGMGKALAGFATGFVAFKALDFLADATNAAAEFNDTVSASGVILGEEALPELEAWADGAARALGASKQQALDAANTFAVFGKSAGLAGQDLTTFSTDLTELAGDLASFRGGTTEEAITAIGAALRGESEPIRRYGVLLDEATLRQRALRLGIIETTSQALTPQQRVLAAQAEIFAQTADAQGDYARTADDMANVQRTLAAEFENVTIEVGEKLLPVLLELATWIRDDGIPLIDDFVDALGSLGDRDSAAGTPFEGIEKAFNDFADAGLMFRDFLTGEGDKINEVLDRVGGDFWDLRQQVKTAMDALGLDFDSALALVEQRAADHDIPQAFSTQLYADQHLVDAAAADMAGGVVTAMEDAKTEAEEVARSTPGSLASQLRAGISDYDDALKELTEVAANSVSDLAERQKIEGILASQELTDALNSDSTRTRLLAQELVADLVSDYELLEPGALHAGELVNPALQDGIESNLNLATAAGEAIVDAAGNPLVDTSWARNGGANVGIAWANGLRSTADYARLMAWEVAAAADPALHGLSPPKEGPLRDIDQGGYNVGVAWADGLASAVDVSKDAAWALADGFASAITPDTLQGFSVAPGAIPDGGTGTVGAGGIHIHLYNMGDPIEEDDDVLESLRLLVPHIRDAVFANG